MEILLTAEIEVVRLHVDDARLLDRLLLTLSENDAERLHNCLRDIVLDREYIFQLAVITFRPEVISISNIHKLRRDAEFVPHLAHTPLERRSHLGLAPHVTNVLVLPLVRERRRTRSNMQRLELC